MIVQTVEPAESWSRRESVRTFAWTVAWLFALKRDERVDEFNEFKRVLDT